MVLCFVRYHFRSVLMRIIKEQHIGERRPRIWKLSGDRSMDDDDDDERKERLLLPIFCFITPPPPTLYLKLLFARYRVFTKTFIHTFQRLLEKSEHTTNDHPVLLCMQQSLVYFCSTKEYTFCNPLSQRVITRSPTTVRRPHKHAFSFFHSVYHVSREHFLRNDTLLLKSYQLKNQKLLK